MRLLDPSHPFFRPTWRRYAIVAICFLWATFEMSQGNDIWAYLFAGIGGYLAYQLIFSYPKDPPSED